MGSGVLKTYHMFETAGILDITYKLYENDRHEILNETDKQMVFQDYLHQLLIVSSLQISLHMLLLKMVLHS